jgi:hypothetical protein
VAGKRGGERGGRKRGGHSRSPRPALLTLEGDMPGIQEAGIYWPQHHSSKAGLGSFSHDHGFHYHGV